METRRSIKSGFRYYTNVDEAIARMFSELKSSKRETEIINLDESLNRILATSIISDVDIPNSNKSAMDGYAVNASETFGSSQDNPSEFREVGKIGIGELPRFDLVNGQTSEVATGSYLPNGSNAVVMIEYTKKIEPNLIQVVKSVVPNQNVIRKGEDIKKGDMIVKSLTKIKAQDIGIIAAVGKDSIEVYKRPKVSVISSGDELIEIGSDKEEAKVYDINRHMTMASIKDAGGEPLDFGIVKDSKIEIENRLKKAISSSDIVTISAGTSVGNKDFIPDIINSMGKPGIIVHGVALKPGSPSGISVIDNTPIVSLPGFPVAAAISFRVFVKPIIEYLIGIKEAEPVVIAKLTRRVASPGGMRTFVRVRLRKYENSLTADPIMVSGSGIVSSMSRADGLLIIPEDKEGVEEGDEEEIILLRTLKVNFDD